jgi:hypothetical protein
VVVSELEWMDENLDNIVPKHNAYLLGNNCIPGIYCLLALKTDLI